MTPKPASSPRSTQFGRVKASPADSNLPAVEQAGLAVVTAAARAALMRPRKQYAPLEARILFDAAGVAAADHQFDDPAAQQREAQRIASEEARAATLVMDSSRENAALTLPAPRGNTVVVIDSRVTDFQSLIAGIDPAATVRVIGSDEDGVAVISQLLGQTGNVSSLQIVSHGQSGAIRLGSSTLNSAALDNADTAAQLQGWQSGMTAGADILILGCDVAQGEKGQTFVQKLADLTQAEISASVDDTGSVAKGGNWVLEFSVGQTESRFAFSEAAMRNYTDVLDSGPLTVLTVPATSLIGSTDNKASVTFDNTGTIGYAPYIAVGFKLTGQDPNNSGNPSEGVRFKPGSATLNSGAIASENEIIFTAATYVADGLGGRINLRDGVGASVTFTAADYGLGVGDQLMVWQLPFGSFTPDQPAARIDFGYIVGGNADSGNTTVQGGEGSGKTLPISSKGFFLLGDTPAGSAAVNQAGVDSKATNPSWFTTQYINTSRELEQVPGSNDRQEFNAVLNIAPGQKIISGAGVTDLANPGITPDRYISRLSVPQIAGTTAASFNIGDIKLTQGAGIGAPLIPGATEYFVVDKASGAPATQNTNGTWSSPGGVEIIAIAAQNTEITGSPALNFSYFIVNAVIDPTTGDDIPQSFDAKHTGKVRFADTDDGQNSSFVVDPAPVQIEYETIQIQKQVAGPTPDVLAAPLNDGGVNPSAVRSGDVLTYTLTIQIGDFYGLRSAVVTDVLPDGVDFNVGSMAVAVANVNGQAFAPIANAGAFMTNANGTLGTYTIPRQADEGGGTITVGGNGKQALQLDLSAALASAGITNGGINTANPGDLLGDKFGTAQGQGLTTVTITYTATVRDTYRDAANGNATGVASQNLLENDVLRNDVRVHGTLLRNPGNGEGDAAGFTPGPINADESTATVTVKDGALLLEVYAINGDTNFARQAGKPLIAPGDNVTYRLRYDLSQGDYKNLALEAFLPDPIFKATDVNADGTLGGAAEFTRIAVATRDPLTGVPNANANWAQAGAFTVGPAHNNVLDGGSGGNIDTPLASALFVDDATAGNRVRFNLGNSDRPSNPGGTPNSPTTTGQKIDLLFTVKAQDGVNFSDDLLLTAQGRETGERNVNSGVTVATPLPDDRIIQVKLVAPTLAVTHGFIATGGAGGAGGDQGGTVTGLALPGAAVIKAAGDSSAGPAITGLSAANAITNGNALNSNIINVDANDAVRGALSIVNTSRAGAYDVRTTDITPPPGFRFASDNATLNSPANNVKVMRGDGEVLMLGTDYTFVGNKIEFIDKDRAIGSKPVDGRADAVLLAGKDADGNPRTDGQNVIIITYDMVVDNTAGAPVDAIAASNTTSNIGIEQYAASNTFGPTANILGVPLTDAATSKIAIPQADIRWSGDESKADKTPTPSDTTALQTTGGNAVVGEAAFFDVLITIPEGTTKGFSAEINLPPGLKLDPSFGTGGVQIFTAAGSDINDAGASQLPANWAGAAPVVASTAAITPATGALAGAIGQPGVGIRINFGDLSNPQDNAANNNQFVIRVRAIVDNTQAADSTSPSANNQAHNPTPPSGAPAEPDGAKGNQSGILRTTTSSSRFQDGADPQTGTGGTTTRINDTTTANDPTITLIEPIVTTVITAQVVDTDPVAAGDQTAAEGDENDIVEYTITLSNPSTGSINAYDLNFSQLLPSQLDTITIESALKGATDVKPQFEIVSNTVQTLGGAPGSATSNLDLAPGETVVIKVRARLNNTAPSVPTVSSTGSTQWTSIDSPDNQAASQNANERTGTDGLLAGALTAGQADAGAGTTSGTGANQAESINGLNDYRSASRGDITIVTPQPVLSHIGGLADTSPLANGANTRLPQDMAIGEVTRFRMVVRIPAGTTPQLSLQPTLPSGYTFINDGSAKVAFVADSNMTSTGTNSLAAAGGASTLGDGINAATGAPGGTGDVGIWGNIQGGLNSSNLSALGADPRALGTGGFTAGTAPTVVVPNANIDATTANAPKFLLGDVNNNDNDNDTEYVVIEFNARVDNSAANQIGKTLDTNFVVRSGTTDRGTSNTVQDKIVEPDISAATKRVVDVQRTAGNTSTAQAATNTITTEVSFSSGNQPNTTAAYDVVLTDSFPASATGNTLRSITVGATTYDVTTPAGVTAATAAGVNFVTTTGAGAGTTITIDKLPPGTAVKAVYDSVVPTTAEQAATVATNAVVRYSGLPDTGTGNISNNGFGGSSVGGDNLATGERNGDDGAATNPSNPADTAGPRNNYRVVDPAGYGTISGQLWDDTFAPDGVIGAPGVEKPMDGVEVILRWAGIDGIFDNADDRVITTTTDVTGAYKFGALPGDDPNTAVNEGKFRITAPATITRNDMDDSGLGTDILTPRFDRTDGDAVGLNIAELTIPDGIATVERDFGYVQPNDPPVNSFNGSTTFPTLAAPFTGPVGTQITEDVPFAFSAANNALIKIADPDGDRGTKLLTTTVTAANGTLAAGNGGGTATVTVSAAGVVTIVGSKLEIDKALATLVYTPVNNFSGADTITVVTNDRGQGGNGAPGAAGADATTPRQAGDTASPDALVDTDVINIVVAPKSDAPRLTIGTGTGVNTSPAALGTGLGNSLTQAVAGTATGVEDTDIPLGISIAPADTVGTAETIPSTVKITGVPAGWVLRDSAGNDITAAAAGATGITPAQATGATLTPPVDVHGAPPVVLSVTVESKDGADVVATTTGTLTVNVTPVNDAPLFDATTTTVLPPFNEDTPPAAGTDVLVAFPGFTDLKDAGKPNAADTRVGVLLTGNAATPAQGKWQYLDGATWTDVPTNLSDTNALYLPDGTQIRFNPALNYNGTPGNLKARLVENDQVATPDLPANNTGTTFGATNVIRPNLDLSAGVGGTSRISANERDVSITVTPLNDTPVVVTPGSTPATALNVGDVPIAFVGPNAITLSDVDTPFNPTAIVTVTITPTSDGRPFISALTPGVSQTSGPAVGTIPPGGGTPIVLSGTIADINETLKNLEYRSVVGYNGTDNFTVKIEDLNNGQGVNGPLMATNTVNVFNIPLNDRPVPTGSTPDYANLLPGSTTPGRTVQELFGSRFTDPRDAPTTNGGDTFAAVAVIGVPPVSQGVYQYSTDNGATWTAITATPATALVLGPTVQVRFVAAPGFIGATTPLKAVLIETDKTGVALPNQGDLVGGPTRTAIPFDTPGSAAPATGDILNLATLDANDIATTNNSIGRSRFSSVANPMLVGVFIEQPINDRPVLTNAAPVVLPSMAEGTPASSAQTVGALFAPRYSDPIDAGQIVGADTFQGVFVTASAANPVTEGVWEYSLDGGTTFIPVPAATNDSSAIYLTSANQLRFKPVDSNYSGTPGQLTVRLVETDQSDVPAGSANGTSIGNSIDALAPGAVVNIAAPLANPSQFATGRVSEPLNLSIIVTPVSDAPILTLGVGPQEPGNPPGTTGVQSSPGSPATGNNATGVVTGSVRGLEDAPIPLGIKIAPADTSNPEAITTVTLAGVPTGWVLRQADGTVIPTPGGSSAALTPAQLLGATLTAPADVHSAGAIGSSPAATLIITVTSTDGSAPPAVTTGTLNVGVTPVNDAPLFPSTDTTVLPAVRSDAPPVGVSIAAAFPGFSDAKDAGKTNGADNRVGVLITSNATSPAQGNWQYFDGANWVDVPRNVSDTNALYLPDGTQIRFNPVSGFSGTPGNLSARLVEDDQAGSNADLPANGTGSGFGPTSVIRPGINLSEGVGRTSRVSGNTRDVSITITSATLPPVEPPVQPPVEPPAGGPVDPITRPLPPGPQALVPLAFDAPDFIASLAQTLPPLAMPDAMLQNDIFVGNAVRFAQSEAAAADSLSSARFASNLGNSGLQPNWLMPEGIPGLDPFTSPLPELQAAVPVPIDAAPRTAMTAEEIARQIECAKPRVVAKPRPPGAIRPAPKFEPGSPAAKRFSEQLKRARARARC